MNSNALFSAVMLTIVSSIGAVGCSTPAPQKTEVQEQAAPKENWQEIRDDAVAFIRMHPGAAQKNAYVTWKHYENAETAQKVWRINQHDIPQEAADALDRLIASADLNLIESDGIYACRYRDNMPQYRINFRRGGKSYQIVSASDCAHAAPWNMIIDGKHFMQLSGETGTALQEALKYTETALTIGDTAGMIMLNAPVTLSDIQGQPQQSPVTWFDAQFRTDSAFGDTLTKIESLFELKLNAPEIACNQAKSSDCKDVSARYTLDIPGDFLFQQSIKFSSGAVSSTLPPASAFEALSKAVQKPVLSAWNKAFEHKEKFHLTYTEQGNCKMIQGLAGHFDLTGNVSCSTWSIQSPNTPKAIYYIGLDAIWIESGHDLKPYFDEVRNGMPKAKRLSYTHYQKPASDMNLFVRLDGRPLAFVTKDGKTTIE